MSMRGPKNVRRAVQTNPTLLRYASAIMEQKICWELLAEKFDRFQTAQQHPTTCNRVCKRTQQVTSNNVGSCWPTMLRLLARSLMTIERESFKVFLNIFNGFITFSTPLQRYIAIAIARVPSSVALTKSYLGGHQKG